MSILQALILGIVQGLTEFLPVSSTGHLIIFPIIFGWKEQPLVFDTTLHLATAAALLVYFRRDLLSLVIAFFKDFFKKKFSFQSYSDQGRLSMYIIIGSIPAGVLGLVYDKYVGDKLNTLIAVAIFLILGSVIMFFAEYYYKRHSLDQAVNLKKSLIVGMFQSIALLPGISRSGASISGGMFCNLTREKATRFSFLLSIPVVAMAGLYKFASSYKELFAAGDLSLAVSFISCFFVGLLAIEFLMRLVKTKGLYGFIIYRLVLAVILLTIGLKG